jgi:hypothetical protein
MVKTKAGNFLKPRWINILLTLIVLALPILREKVQLEDGGYVIARYSPLVLVGSYAWLKDWYPFLLMLGFSLFVYIATSTAIILFGKLFKFWKKKFLT